MDYHEVEKCSFLTKMTQLGLRLWSDADKFSLEIWKLLVGSLLYTHSKIIFYVIA